VKENESLSKQLERATSIQKQLSLEKDSAVKENESLAKQLERATSIQKQLSLE
jgi:hypothetical protein